MLQVNRFNPQLMSDGEHTSVWSIVIVGDDHEFRFNLPKHTMKIGQVGVDATKGRKMPINRNRVFGLQRFV